METFEKVIWGIVIVGTIGIASLVFAVVYLNRAKTQCDTCLTQLQFSKEHGC